MIQQVQGDIYGMFLVCIDTVKDGVISGSLYHPCAKRPFRFHGLDHMLQLADHWMDRCAYPLAFFERRVYGPSARQGCQYASIPKRRVVKIQQSKTAFAQHRGRRATVLLQLKCRQNGSWQGRSTYMRQEGTTVHLVFRSALELVLAIREQVQCEQASARNTGLGGQTQCAERQA